MNKERARAGEARESSRLSRKDIVSGRRGGLRSGTRRPKGRTKEQLYNEAKKMGVEGRSKMSVVEELPLRDVRTCSGGSALSSKAQLQRAVDRRK